MKHNIRINGEVKELDCELGTGILDKNGEEIFEGDMLMVKDSQFMPAHVGFQIFATPRIKGEFKVQEYEVVGRAW